MKSELIQQHLNSILTNIASINKLTEQIDFNQFVREEQIKEEVYSRLQEIGQAAYEIDMATDERLDLDFDISVLTSFKNVRYNMEIEQSHPPVWALIQGSFKDIAEQIEQSSQYLDVPR
ncbi:MAG: hypothetical protein RIA69_02540 [Cyclobacteriaceae bacterium]